jgi:hypothetical protein
MRHALPPKQNQPYRKTIGRSPFVGYTHNAEHQYRMGASTIPRASKVASIIEEYSAAIHIKKFCKPQHQSFLLELEEKAFERVRE